MKRSIGLAGLLAAVMTMSAAPGLAQPPATVESLAQRLAALEAQNAALRDELTAIRKELESVKPASPEQLQEKVELQAGQLAEQAQVKVEGTQRVPIRLTGMLLFNYFRNGPHGGSTTDYPGIPQIARAPVNIGAGLRQSVFGLDFQQPQGAFGARYAGSLLFDLGGQGSNPAIAPNLPRLRSGSLEGQWKRRGFLVGQEKVIFNPRDPNSLAQVLFGEMIGTGNLYGFRPQVRYEERIPMGAANEVRARIGFVQTQEDYPSSIQAEFLPSLELKRPSIEGHVQFRHALDERRRFEAAFGFHKSSTHIAGTSIPSNIVSVDWFLNPIARVEFSGAAFSGQAIPLSGRRQSFVTVVRPAPDVIRVIPIRMEGGWAQLALLVAPRFTVNLTAGFEDPRDTDVVLVDMVTRSTGAALNTFYRIAPNIVVGFEAAQMHAHYKGGQQPRNNHYNTYLAFIF